MNDAGVAGARLFAHTPSPASLLRDPVILASLAVFTFLVLAYTTPTLSPPWFVPLAEYVSPLARLLLVLAAFSVGRVGRVEERRFARLFVVAFGAWLAVQLSYLVFAAAVDHPVAEVATDATYLVFYTAIALASHFPPHRSHGSRAARSIPSVEPVALALAATAMLVYFVVVPSTLDYASYDTWVPSMVMYVALDAYLLLRFLWLLRDPDARGYRGVYVWIAAGVALWLVADVLELMHQAGRIELPVASAADVLWWLPYPPMIVAGRLLRRPRPVQESQRPAPVDAHNGAVAPLVVLTFLLPLIHVVLHGFGWGNELSVARSFVVLAAMLALGGLLFAHQRQLERHNRGLRSDLRRANEDLVQSHKMQALGRLAGGVAHDFNNLLTALLGHAADLARSLPAESPLRGEVDGIERAAKRAAALTRQLLTFSRRQVLHPQVLDLNEAVADMESMVRRLIGEHVELRLELAPEPCAIEVDPGQLEQVLLNLVVNARDAMPGGGRLTVATAIASADPAHDGASGWVALIVRDTGHGMTRDTRERIFEPFFTTKGPGHGTGMGLAFVYGIVAQSGGRIRVHSEPGAGTTFAVELPRSTGVPAAPDSRATDREVRIDGARRTVLLVEDEETVRNMVRSVLQRAGVHLLEARDGLEALDVARAHGGRIDLLLTDVVMPRMGGPELAERLYAAQPGMRVLFISGYSSEEVTWGDGTRTAEVLDKPFTPATLTRRVRELLALAPR